jgi:hypothetical protein
MHYFKTWQHKLLVTISLIFIALSLSGGFDTPSRNVLNNAFKQAVTVFATAKALNGVISLAQGTEIGPPGITVAVGEVLDPINDLVEQFSWVMLASITSLGVQIIFMDIVTHPFFNSLLVVMIVGVNFWIISRHHQHTKVHETLVRFTLVMIFLRLSIPLMALSSELIYTQVIQNEYNIVSLDQEMTQITQKVENINSSNSTYSGLSKFFSQEYYNALTTQYKAAANQTSDAIVRLIIAFAFQSIIFPLLFLFLFYKLMVRTL